MALRRIAIGLAGATLAVACTQDYGSFKLADTSSASSGIGGSTSSSSSSTSGGASSSSTSTLSSSSTGGGGVGGVGGLATGGMTGSGGVGATGGTGATGGMGGVPCGGPCNLPHANATCVSDMCAITSCNPSYGDCNTMAMDGCETPTGTDVGNCGACGRACSATGTTATICSSGLCASTCAPGRANCSKPATGPDDGCEVDATTTANCGGCGNNCALQGLTGTGFVCGQNLVCKCSTSTACKTSGNGTAVCDSTSGQCSCNGVTCQPGEACVKQGATGFVCSCNGATACGVGNVCCQTPAGCKDLTVDPANCGACGHACAPAQSCVAGVCT